MLVDEANKWNDVHSVLNIGRTPNNQIPLGNDGNNVISWIDEDVLKSAYGLNWEGTVGWTIKWLSGNCTRIIEADVFFNPNISLFTPQNRVEYDLGYQEIALHELGHVITQDHENTSMAVMTSGDPVSDVLYTSDKVGWLRSAAYRFSVTDRSDMGVFPLRGAGESMKYGILSPSTVAKGENVQIQNMTVQNLSSALPFDSPSFKVVLESISTGSPTPIGEFFWEDFCAYCTWSGDLTFQVPGGIPVGRYRVVAVFQESDSDGTNNRAVFGTIQVK